jgi:hypothetical protein
MLLISQSARVLANHRTKETAPTEAVGCTINDGLEGKSKTLVQELAFASRLHQTVLSPNGACERPPYFRPEFIVKLSER